MSYTDSFHHFRADLTAETETTIQLPDNCRTVTIHATGGQAGDVFYYAFDRVGDDGAAPASEYGVGSPALHFSHMMSRHTLTLYTEATGVKVSVIAQH